LGYVAIDNEYHAIGSGSAFALGVLYANGTIREAFEAASKWSNSSSGYDVVEITL
jgi:ATP-dependent protease HslVU (ClpYQ) peptidase subunit